MVGNILMAFFDYHSELIVSWNIYLMQTSSMIARKLFCKLIHPWFQFLRFLKSFCVYCRRIKLSHKFPNLDFFLIRIFRYLDLQEDLLWNLNIQSKCGKIWTIKNDEFGKFLCSVKESYREIKWNKKIRLSV